MSLFRFTESSVRSTKLLEYSFRAIFFKETCSFCLSYLFLTSTTLLSDIFHFLNYQTFLLFKRKKTERENVIMNIEHRTQNIGKNQPQCGDDFNFYR